MGEGLANRIGAKDWRGGNLTVTSPWEGEGTRVRALALAVFTRPVWDIMPIPGYGHATRSLPALPGFAEGGGGGVAGFGAQEQGGEGEQVGQGEEELIGDVGVGRLELILQR